MCSSSGSCDFENDFCGYRNVQDLDDFDWMRSKGTRLGMFGPSVDHTLGTFFGYYAHFDQGPELGLRKGNKAWLISDHLTTSNSACFTWFVYLEGKSFKWFCCIFCALFVCLFIKSKHN